MERSRGPLPAGSYTVKVQSVVLPSEGSGAPALRLDDWQLVVERIAVP